MSYQWCDFLLNPIKLIKLLHAEQIRSSKTPQARLLSRKIIRQLPGHPIAPLRRLDLATDIGADLPIQVHQFGTGHQRSETAASPNLTG
ncbi:hypothetical protein C4K29_2509 [Pseudomonas chlororaphis subsp. piscium]|nr:hypothetical protein C4K29_2509 [Pseudomonas chlororaphis subsp. piscium]